jgi:hypothetical protein
MGRVAVVCCWCVVLGDSGRLQASSNWRTALVHASDVTSPSAVPPAHHGQRTPAAAQLCLACCPGCACVNPLLMTSCLAPAVACCYNPRPSATHWSIGQTSRAIWMQTLQSASTLLRWRCLLLLLYAWQWTGWWAGRQPTPSVL